MVIYCDESGTHNNRYLVIAALIVDDTRAAQRLRNAVTSSISLLRKQGLVLEELHAKDLDTAQKEVILNKFTSKSDHRIAYLVADKNFIEPKLKAQANLCYNYLFGHLMKRILPKTTEDVTVVCDNRTVKTASKNSLPDYIKLEAYAKWGVTGSITIQFEDSRVVKNLQAVDLIANTVYAKYNLNREHLYNKHAGYYSEVVHSPSQDSEIEFKVYI